MAVSNAHPFEIIDFSKGETDHVHDQKQGAAAEIINFVVGNDMKPISRWGSEIDDENNAEIPTGKSVSALINYANSDKLFYQSERSIFYRNPSLFTELVGPSGNQAFSTGDDNSVSAFSQWNRHVYMTNTLFARPMKMYKDVSGNYQIRNQSLPSVAAPTVTAGVAGALSFVFAFHYSYTYTVFGLTYEMIGPVTTVVLDNSTDPVTGPIQISGLPVLANGGTDNYDTANIKIKIYRSEANGTFLQQTGEVTNGTTIFTDSQSDIDLANSGTSLYTNDGTVDLDPVPLHKYNHVVNNTGYFAHIIDIEGESPYKIRQSTPNVPDSAPIDFEISVDDAVMGISSVRSQPIVLCKKYIYRIDGGFDRFGRGGMSPIRISDFAGCISHNSIVQAENGLFWCGNDGFYYTDGYQVMKVSDHRNEKYKAILKNTDNTERIQGRYYEKERLIMWSMQENSANHGNDVLMIVDLKWGVSDEMTFTRWNGASFKPSAIEIFNKKLYRGHPSGFVLRHDESLTSDVKVNIYRSVDKWVKETIRWKISTIHYNFGGTFYRKIPTRILLTAADIGNTTIQITAINDDGRVTRNCRPIRIRQDFIWRDDDFVWRESEFIWRAAGLIEQWRRFPKGGLRLSTLQLVIENGFSPVTDSDFLGNATYNATLKTVTLDDAIAKWPTQSEDYVIASDVDGYVKEFLITELSADNVITVNDPLNQLPTGSRKWVIRGYKKDENLHLLGFNIHWNNVSATQKTYSSAAASTGENA